MENKGNTNPYSPPGATDAGIAPVFTNLWLRLFIVSILPLAVWGALDQYLAESELATHSEFMALNFLLYYLLFFFAVGSCAAAARVAWFRFGQVIVFVSGVLVTGSTWLSSARGEPTTEEIIGVAGGLLLLIPVYGIFIWKARYFPGLEGRVRVLMAYEISTFVLLIGIAVALSFLPDSGLLDAGAGFAIQLVSFVLWYRTFWNCDLNETRAYAERERAQLS